MVLVFQDITERKRVQKELRRAQEKLEIRVQERTKELATANKALQVEINLRSRAESALRRTHDELELRVKERTKDLQATNKQLQSEIAERRQAQEALQRYKDIFDFAELGVAVGAADGSILEWINPAYARMHGFTVEELIGTPILDLYLPEHAARVARFIRLANETGHIAFETVHYRKDGSTFPILVELTAVKNANGKVLGSASN